MEPPTQLVVTHGKGFGLLSPVPRSVDLPLLPPVATTGLHKGSILRAGRCGGRRVAVIALADGRFARLTLPVAPYVAER
jgi:hypothetical protein